MITITRLRPGFSVPWRQPSLDVEHAATIPIANRSSGTDIILSVPLLLFAIGIVAACSTSKDGCLHGTLKPGLSLVIVIISLFTWPYVTRLVRGNTLSLREREFVEASRSLGASDLRIMFREILPNLVSPIIVYASLLIPSNILFEAYLSFLGLGVPDDTPSWGSMVSDSLQNFGSSGIAVGR